MDWIRKSTRKFSLLLTGDIRVELPEEIQSKILYIYSVINERSLRSRHLDTNDQILNTAHDA